MRSRAFPIAMALVMTLALARPVPALADELLPRDGATARWMIAQEKAWADMACGGKWVATELLASDFQGTAPKGARYGKPPGEPPPDPGTPWSTDCRLDGADVRFYAADVAVVFGAESKTVPLPDAKQERRCLVWTDMWLRRQGRWQIIAVQDNRVACPGLGPAQGGVDASPKP